MDEIQYKIDLKASQALYQKHQNLLESKQCYHNVFTVFTYNKDKFKSGEWKIAYGFISLFDNTLYGRHCFIIDKDNHIIDPTIYTIKNDNRDRNYLIFKIFDDIKDYIEALEKENGYVSLDAVLRPTERLFVKEQMQKGKFFIT